MFCALVLSSIYISWVDWREHRISNKSLLLLSSMFTLLNLTTHSQIFYKQAIASLLIGIIGYKFGLGAGDVKLMALLSLFFAPASYLDLRDLLYGFVVVACASMVAVYLSRRSMQGSIALGPAICAAFIWCAR